MDYCFFDISQIHMIIEKPIFNLLRFQCSFASKCKALILNWIAYEKLIIFFIYSMTCFFIHKEKFSFNYKNQPPSLIETYELNRSRKASTSVRQTSVSQQFTFRVTTTKHSHNLLYILLFLDHFKKDDYNSKKIE